ncbi:putative zinc finger (CCCH type) protein [Neospora caninum Liverpool]|uniref:Putative zinc finger (CCCH type) protein n=1 Tax=Neospora caninum (strain Liverpool) TaxID=572307 RepID=F0VR50_NEOCL|nr:putative zinc finger (CCCH type) protein [Neospora caninum Liverpool]CBZ56198.1 putative zinc finger (CCCH type) protein [Neospora caninum Liverpool]|eukprot:XP_003886223.1 putative zinc finger (CCCH type) protein [Neospora caninum Liverpool]
MAENGGASGASPSTREGSQAQSFLSFPRLSSSTKTGPSVSLRDASGPPTQPPDVFPSSVLATRGEKSAPTLAASNGVLSYKAVAARAVSQRVGGSSAATCSDSERDARRESEPSRQSRAFDGDSAGAVPPGERRQTRHEKTSSSAKGEDPQESTQDSGAEGLRLGGGTRSVAPGSAAEVCEVSARSPSPPRSKRSKGDQSERGSGTGKGGEKKANTTANGHGKRKHKKLLDLRLPTAAASDLPVFEREGEQDAHLAVMLKPGNRKRRSCVDSVSGCLLFWGARCPSKLGAGSGGAWCIEGDKCLACHTDAEYFGHPAVYKTVLCTNSRSSSNRSCCFSSASAAPGTSPRKRRSEALLAFCGRVRCCCWKAHSKGEQRAELAKKYTPTSMGKQPSPVGPNAPLSTLSHDSHLSSSGDGQGGVSTPTPAREQGRTEAALGGGLASVQNRRSSFGVDLGDTVGLRGSACGKEPGSAAPPHGGEDGEALRRLSGSSAAGNEKLPKKGEDRRAEGPPGAATNSTRSFEKGREAVKSPVGDVAGPNAVLFPRLQRLSPLPKGSKGALRDAEGKATCGGKGGAEKSSSSAGSEKNPPDVEKECTCSCPSLGSWRENGAWRGAGAWGGSLSQKASDPSVPLTPGQPGEEGKGKSCAVTAQQTAATGTVGAEGIGPANVFLPDGSLDLDLFKVFPCRNRNVLHERKSCPFYHNYRDKRRAPVTYQAEQCEEQFDLDTTTIQCSKGDNCERCHNRHELLYHPNIYKQRFCSNFSKNEKNGLTACARGVFCAFAHSRAEIRATLFTEQEEREPDCQFFVAKFKTVWCPYGSQHDWHTCVYAHTYQDCRRAPAIGYGSEPCPAWSKDLHSADYDRRCPHGQVPLGRFLHANKPQKSPVVHLYLLAVCANRSSILARLTAASRRAGAAAGLGGSEGANAMLTAGSRTGSSETQHVCRGSHRHSGLGAVVQSSAFPFSVGGVSAGPPPGSSPKALPALSKASGANACLAPSSKPASCRRRSSSSSYSASYAAYAPPPFPSYPAGAQGSELVQFGAASPLEACHANAESMCDAVEVSDEGLHALPRKDERRRIAPSWSATLAVEARDESRQKAPARRLSRGSVHEFLSGAGASYRDGSGSSQGDRRENLQSWSEPASCFPPSFQPAGGRLASANREKTQEHLLLQVAAMLLNGSSRESEAENFAPAHAGEHNGGEELQGHTFSAENAEVSSLFAPHTHDFMGLCASLSNRPGFSGHHSAEDDSNSGTDYAPSVLFTPHSGEEGGRPGAIEGPRDTFSLGSSFFPAAFPGDSLPSGLSDAAPEERAKDEGALFFSGAGSRRGGQADLRARVAAANGPSDAFARERLAGEGLDTSALLLPLAVAPLSSSSPPFVSSGGHPPVSSGESGRPAAALRTARSSEELEERDRDEAEAWSVSTEGCRRHGKGGPTASQGDLWSSPSLETLASRGDGGEQDGGSRPLERNSAASARGRRFMRLFDNGSLWGPSTGRPKPLATEPNDAQQFASLSFSSSLSSSPPGLLVPDGAEAPGQARVAERPSPHNLAISILHSSPPRRKGNLWGTDEENGTATNLPSTSLPGSYSFESRKSGDTFVASSFSVVSPAGVHPEDSQRDSTGNRGRRAPREEPSCPSAVASLWGVEWRSMEEETGAPSAWAPLASSAPPGLLRPAVLKGRRGATESPEEGEASCGSGEASSGLASAFASDADVNPPATVLAGRSASPAPSSFSNDALEEEKEEDLARIPTAAVTAVETAAVALWGAFDEEEDERKRDFSVSSSSVALSASRKAEEGEERNLFHKKLSFLEEAMSALWKMKRSGHAQVAEEDPVDGKAVDADGDRWQGEAKHIPARDVEGRRQARSKVDRTAVLAVSVKDRNAQLACLKSLLGLLAWHNVILYVTDPSREEKGKPEDASPESPVLQALATLKVTARYHVSHLREEELTEQILEGALSKETEKGHRLLVVHGRRVFDERPKDADAQAPTQAQTKDVENTLPSRKNPCSLFGLLRLQRQQPVDARHWEKETLAVVGLHSAPADFWRTCREEKLTLGGLAPKPMRAEQSDPAARSLLSAAPLPGDRAPGTRQPVGPVGSEHRTSEEEAAPKRLSFSCWPTVAVHLVVSPSPRALLQSEGIPEGEVRDAYDFRTGSLLPSASLPLWSCLFGSLAPSRLSPCAPSLRALPSSPDITSSRASLDRSSSCPDFLPESGKPCFAPRTPSPSRSVGEDLTAATAAGTVTSASPASSVSSLPSVSEFLSLSPSLRPHCHDRSSSQSSPLTLPLLLSTPPASSTVAGASGASVFWGASSLQVRRPAREILAPTSGDDRSVSGETAMTTETAASSAALSDARAGEDGPECGGEKEGRKAAATGTAAKPRSGKKATVQREQSVEDGSLTAKRWAQVHEGRDSDSQWRSQKGIEAGELFGELLVREMCVLAEALRKEAADAEKEDRDGRLVFCWAPSSEEQTGQETSCERLRAPRDVATNLRHFAKDSVASASPAASSLRLLSRSLVPSLGHVQRLLLLVSVRADARLDGARMFSRLSACSADSVFVLPAGSWSSPGAESAEAKKRAEGEEGVKTRRQPLAAGSTLAVCLRESPAAAAAQRVEANSSFGVASSLSASPETRCLTLAQLVSGCSGALRLDLSRFSPLGNSLFKEEECGVRPMRLDVSELVAATKREASERRVESPRDSRKKANSEEGEIADLWCALCGEAIERQPEDLGSNRETTDQIVATAAGRTEVCCFVRCGYTPEDPERELDCPHVFHRSCLDQFLVGPQFTRAGGRCFCRSFVPRGPLSWPSLAPCETGTGRQTASQPTSQRRSSSFQASMSSSRENQNSCLGVSPLKFLPASSGSASRRTDDPSDGLPELRAPHEFEESICSSFFPFGQDASAISPSAASSHDAALLEGSEEDAAVTSPRLCGGVPTPGSPRYGTVPRGLVTPAHLPALLRELLVGLSQVQDLHVHVALRERTRKVFAEETGSAGDSNGKGIEKAQKEGDEKGRERRIEWCVSRTPRLVISPTDIWVATRETSLERRDPHEKATAVSTCVDVLGSSLLPAFVPVSPGKLLGQCPQLFPHAAARLVLFVCSGGAAGGRRMGVREDAAAMDASEKTQGDSGTGVDLHGVYDTVSGFPPLLQHLFLLLSSGGTPSSYAHLHREKRELAGLAEDTDKVEQEDKVAFPASFLLLSDAVRHHPFFWSTAQKLDFLDKLQFVLSHVCATPRGASHFLAAPASSLCAASVSEEGMARRSTNPKHQKEWRACVEKLAEGWREKVHRDLLEAVDTPMAGRAGAWRAAECNLTPLSPFSNDLEGLLRFIKTLRTWSLVIGLKVLTSSAVADLVEVYIHPTGTAATTWESPSKRGPRMARFRRTSASTFEDQRARRILLQNFDSVCLEQIHQVHPRLFLLLFAYVTSAFEGDSEMESIFDFLREFTLSSKPLRDSFWFEAVM